MTSQRADVATPGNQMNCSLENERMAKSFQRHLVLVLLNSPPSTAAGSRVPNKNSLISSLSFFSSLLSLSVVQLCSSTSFRPPTQSLQVFLLPQSGRRLHATCVSGRCHAFPSGTSSFCLIFEGEGIATYNN